MANDKRLILTPAEARASGHMSASQRQLQAMAQRIDDLQRVAENMNLVTHTLVAVLAGSGTPIKITPSMLRATARAECDIEKDENGDLVLTTTFEENAAPEWARNTPIETVTMAERGVPPDA